jgi:hypothetical protein
LPGTSCVEWSSWRRVVCIGTGQWWCS